MRPRLPLRLGVPRPYAAAPALNGPCTRPHWGSAIPPALKRAFRPPFIGPMTLNCGPWCSNTDKQGARGDEWRQGVELRDRGPESSPRGPKQSAAGDGLSTSTLFGPPIEVAAHPWDALRPGVLGPGLGVPRVPGDAGPLNGHGTPCEATPLPGSLRGPAPGAGSHARGPPPRRTHPGRPGGARRLHGRGPPDQPVRPGARRTSPKCLSPLSREPDAAPRISRTAVVPQLRRDEDVLDRDPIAS